MRVLVDTHALLWYIEGSRHLSESARDILQSHQSELMFSVAAAWEILVKWQKGKLHLAEPAPSFIRRHIRAMSMRVLPLRLRHVLHLAALPPVHGDPFDRLLIAQSITEQIPLLSSDDVVRQYPVQCIW